MPRNPALAQMDALLDSLNDDSRARLQRTVERLQQKGFISKTDRARLYASYDEILMLPPQQAGFSAPQPLSRSMLLGRLANG